MEPEPEPELAVPGMKEPEPEPPIPVLYILEPVPEPPGPGSGTGYPVSFFNFILKLSYILNVIDTKFKQ